MSIALENENKIAAASAGLAPPSDRLSGHKAFGETLLATSNLHGLRFYRRATAFGHAVDYWCPARRLAVYICRPDNKATSSDLTRDSELFFEAGVVGIRFSLHSVVTRPNVVISEILSLAMELPAYGNHLARPRFARLECVLTKWRRGMCGTLMKLPKMHAGRRVHHGDCTAVTAAGPVTNDEDYQIAEVSSGPRIS